MAETMVSLICRHCSREFTATAGQVKARGRTYCSRECSAAARTRPIADRLNDLSIYEPNSGCRLYLGVLDRDGYGLMTNAGHTEMAHRAAYRVGTGSLDRTLEVDHLCRNRACIEISHLEPVTHRVNSLRGMSPTAIVIRTGRCKRGHVLADVGVYRLKSGNGICKPCSTQRSREYRQRLARERI